MHLCHLCEFKFNCVYFPSPLPPSLPPSSSKLPYDVSNDQALDHEEVRKKIGRTVEILKDVVGRFQQSIFDSIDNIP